MATIFAQLLLLAAVAAGPPAAPRLGRADDATKARVELALAARRAALDAIEDLTCDVEAQIIVNSAEVPSSVNGLGPMRIAGKMAFRRGGWFRVRFAETGRARGLQIGWLKTPSEQLRFEIDPRGGEFLDLSPPPGGFANRWDHSAMDADPEFAFGSYLEFLRTVPCRWAESSESPEEVRIKLEHEEGTIREFFLAKAFDLLPSKMVTWLRRGDEVLDDSTYTFEWTRVGGVLIPKSNRFEQHNRNLKGGAVDQTTWFEFRNPTVNKGIPDSEFAAARLDIPLGIRGRDTRKGKPQFVNWDAAGLADRRKTSPEAERARSERVNPRAEEDAEERREAAFAARRAYWLKVGAGLAAGGAALFGGGWWLRRRSRAE